MPTSTTRSAPRPEPAQLETECRNVVGDLRGALLELYGSVDADPSQPQEVSRRFGLNKNLTWKVSKILSDPDGLSAVKHFPGASGWDILVSAMTDAGAPAGLIERVRSSLREFDTFVARHAGTRAHLDLILDSMGIAGSDGAQLETSRQLAFQGNSGIWGVQARVRLALGVVTPSATDPNQVDTTLIRGLIGFRRLRPTVSWPLFRVQEYDEQGNATAVDEIPIEQPADPKKPWLLRKFSSPNLPEFESLRDGGATEYVLPRGPVGNTAAFDCYIGGISRGRDRYATKPDDFAEFGATISLPIETLIFDLIIDERLGVDRPPSVLVFGQAPGSTSYPLRRDSDQMLPLSERCVELVGRPPVVITPLVPRYPELLSLVLDRMGGEAGRCRGYRLTLPHPPMSSTVVLRWPLPEKR